MSPITRDTTVKEALDSSAKALDLFKKHGVDPTVECGLESLVITLDRAVARCGLQDVDGLIAELNKEL